MATLKPPKSLGSITGFPYSLFWEEFGEIWNELGCHAGVEIEYERLLAKRKTRDLPRSGGPEREDIGLLVRPLKLEPEPESELVSKLYRIAASCRIPKLKLELGEGAAATKKRLRAIARTSEQLASHLDQIQIEIEVMLGLIRAKVGAISMTPQFRIAEFVGELRDLRASAELMASEVPCLPRGTSVDVFQARLMEAATKAIGAASDIEIKVKQTDSEGRKPRPGSVSGEVLFKFLQIVDPSMTDATKVRLFKGFNRAWQALTNKQCTALTPTHWPHHAARTKLIK